MSAGTLSYLFAFTAYLALTVLLVTSWRGRRIGIWILLAAISSTAWAGIAAAGTMFGMTPYIPQIAEIVRDATWCLFLLQLLQPGSQEESPDQRAGLFEAPPGDDAPARDNSAIRWRRLFAWVFALTVAIILSGPILARYLDISAALTRDAELIAWLVLPVFGLLMIEQLYRNASVAQRWAIKYLCLGIGGIFAYDFYLFADALLFKQLDARLWTARGIVNALAVPFIAVSIARNPSWSLRIHVSREVVFHSVTLVGAGVYLLIMAGAGYLLRLYGGAWGNLLQIGFLAGTAALLATLLFSDRIRAKVRVLLSKHFFSFKYDYRNEWLRFTQTLAESEQPVPERVIHAMANLVNSPGGILWARQENHHFTLLASHSMPQIQVQPGPDTDSLIAFLESREWIIDVTEYQREPGLYEGLDLPAWLSNIPDAWLIVPLLSREQMIGILLLKRSDVESTINWEDRDLLRMAGQQAASQLAQHLSDQALMQARQFEAFNRLSAYVVHDLKNILAQQALIVSNAEKHKSNPAFVDDVIDTIRNSVERMTRLMEQMRSGMRGSEARAVSLNRVLSDVVFRRAAQKPVPALELPGEELVVTADREQLATVFNHMVQNAQEATPEDGSITVRLSDSAGQAIIEVEDTGCGMDAAFVQDRLFRPFDSTKGLTGMGIGVFESREVVRALGGDIAVRSTPGKGSSFRITLPLAVKNNA